MGIFWPWREKQYVEEGEKPPVSSWCNILPYNVVCFFPGAPVELGATAQNQGVKETHEIITIHFCWPNYCDLLLTLTVISNYVIITDWATETGKQAIDVLCTHYHLHLDWSEKLQNWLAIKVYRLYRVIKNDCKHFKTYHLRNYFK